MRISAFWTLLAVVCVGCRSAEEADRQDCGRLYQFLRTNYGDYQRALERDAEAVAAVGAEAPRIVVATGANQLERLRQQILNPKHTYKYIGDRLAGITVDAPRAEALKQQALDDLRAKEKALLVFTTLLKYGSEKLEARKMDELPEEVGELPKAVREHPAPEDRLGAVMRELEGAGR